MHFPQAYCDYNFYLSLSILSFSVRVKERSHNISCASFPGINIPRQQQPFAFPQTPPYLQLVLSKAARWKEKKENLNEYMSPASTSRLSPKSFCDRDPCHVLTVYTTGIQHGTQVPGLLQMNKGLKLCSMWTLSFLKEPLRRNVHRK